VDINTSGAGLLGVYPSITADASGNVSGSIPIPSDTPSGGHSITLGDETSGQVVSATFSVT